MTTTQEVIECGRCRYDVPSGSAHIVVSPYGPEMHVLYCPGCCPCAVEPEPDE